jgi:hypothetical protein
MRKARGMLASIKMGRLMIALSLLFPLSSQLWAAEQPAKGETGRRLFAKVYCLRSDQPTRRYTDSFLLNAYATKAFGKPFDPNTFRQDPNYKEALKVAIFLNEQWDIALELLKKYSPDDPETVSAKDQGVKAEEGAERVAATGGEEPTAAEIAEARGEGKTTAAKEEPPEIRLLCYPDLSSGYKYDPIEGKEKGDQKVGKLGVLRQGPYGDDSSDPNVLHFIAFLDVAAKRHSSETGKESFLPELFYYLAGQLYGNYRHFQGLDEKPATKETLKAAADDAVERVREEITKEEERQADGKEASLEARQAFLKQLDELAKQRASCFE